MATNQLNLPSKLQKYLFIMIVASRALTRFEKYFLASLETCQLVLEFENPKIVTEVVDRFKGAVIGLHLKHDMENLYAIKGDVPVHELPASLKTPSDCAKWCVDNMNPFCDGTLAAIACNENRVALNSNHCVADGGFLHYLLDHALDANIGDHPVLPASIDEIFKNELNNGHEVDGELSLVSRISTERHDSPNFVQNASYTNFEIPASSLQAYDKKSGKVKALTEYLWMTLTLAASALQNKFTSLGVSTCVDIRKLIKSQYDPLSTANFFTGLNVIAKGVSLNQTLGDFQKSLRKDFLEKLNSDFLMNSIKTDFKHGYEIEDEDKPPMENTIQVTNVGPLKFKRPITDFWVQQHMVCNSAAGNICLLSFSKVNEKINNVVCRLRYSPTAISEETAQMLTDCVKYGIQNFPLSMTAQEAFDEYRRFQS